MQADSQAVSASREWTITRETTDALLRRGEHSQADSVLTAFRARFPGTPASSDALFQRALLRADPASRVHATRDAIADLRAYEAGGALQPNFVAAGVMRRVLGQIDSLRTVAGTVRATVVAPVTIDYRDSLKVRDEELARLKLDIEQTRAELDRVRRRLAPPRRP